MGELGECNLGAPLGEIEDELNQSTIPATSTTTACDTPLVHSEAIDDVSWSPLTGGHRGGSEGAGGSAAVGILPDVALEGDRSAEASDLDTIENFHLVIDQARLGLYLTSSLQPRRAELWEAASVGPRGPGLQELILELLGRCFSRGSERLAP